MDKRPALNSNISVRDFKAFYWLKKELQAFCKQEDLQRTGSKLELTERICSYLETGQKPPKVSKVQKEKRSTFNWNTEKLSSNTVITNNYKNTEQVRQFFETKIGKRFKFNVVFMRWMKTNVGKTLADAMAAWEQMEQAKKNRTAPKDIAPQFEYNRYLRDFLADNPNKNRSMGIQLWHIKKTMRGDNVYQPSDLQWLEKNENMENSA